MFEQHATLDEATPEIYGIVPFPHKKPSYLAREYIEVVQMELARKKQLTDTLDAIGYVSHNSGRIHSGAALLIASNLVLTSAHCFPYEEGYINFPALGGGSRRAKVCFDGMRHCLGGRLDFKILLLSESIDVEIIKPLRLMVSTSTGRSLHIYYRSDRQLCIKEYISISIGGHASRSDHASVATSFGESGGARYSLTHCAIHAMHQGESEGLTINAIVSELATLKLSGRDHSSSVARNILDLLTIIDIEQLGTQWSSTPLVPGAVRPEARQEHIIVTNGEPFVTPKYLPHHQYFLDTKEAIRQLNFDKLWLTEASNPIADYGSVRIDIQKPAPFHKNIQVQQNGIRNGPSSIAGVLLDKRFASLTNEHQKRAVLNKVCNAFINGVYEGVTHQIFVKKVIDLSWEI